MRITTRAQYQFYNLFSENMDKESIHLRKNLNLLFFLHEWLVGCMTFIRPASSRSAIYLSAIFDPKEVSFSCESSIAI